jgi:hypothetical protein
MLPDNKWAIELVKKMGFKLKQLEDETVKATLNLKEEIDESKPLSTPSSKI